MDSSVANHAKTPQNQVQDYIDTTLAALLDELSSPNGRPTITLKRRSRKSLVFINPSNRALETSETGTCISYTWPGKDAHEAWRFTVSVRILAAISEAVHSGLVVSKRDIYYNDPVCFGSQRVVDMAIDDIAHTVGVDRAALNVEAAAKGLVAGCYRLIMSNEVTDARSSTKDVLIPRVEDIQDIDMSEVKWVLVIEKEAVYRRLSRSNYHMRAAAGKGILVTGKGYPDLCTRAFVRYLFERSSRGPSTPSFYALVDNDPDGMAILSTYKFGSVAHARENGRLNVPGLQPLGFNTSDIVIGADPLGDDALLPLTARDRRKIVAMLTNSPVWAVDGPEPEWRAELQQMLMLNLKAETEILYQRDGGLEGWIDRKMLSRISETNIDSHIRLS